MTGPASPELPRTVRTALDFIQKPDRGRFDEIARLVFAFQFEKNEPYQRLCRRRGITPDRIQTWTDIPAVPTEAFKLTRLTTGASNHVFRTSGTTRGPRERGEHHLPGLDLYDASWEPLFRRYVLPDRETLRTLSLISDRSTLPDSSLSFMVTRIMEEFGDSESDVFMGGNGLDLARLLDALEQAGDADLPVLVLGTALGFLELLEELERRGRSLALPPGSRIMDTGGLKGRTRKVSREDLLDRYEAWMGIPRSFVVGEYGMTELCSQFYETHLADTLHGNLLPGPRRFRGPPWTRTRVLDPERLEPLPRGETGLLAHFDLANAWTVVHVLTEDLGMEEEDGFRLLGRARGAELRGCSLATEELLDG